MFSSFVRVAAVRAAMATTTPDKFPEKAHFFASNSIGLDHCQGNRVAWRQTKIARISLLRFDAATPAMTPCCFSPSTALTSRIRGSKWRDRTCSLFCICAVHSFIRIVVFATLSFVFILLSVLTPCNTDLFVRAVWRRCTQGGEVQRRLRAPCCSTSDTGPDNKASSFPETEKGTVFLCRPAFGASFGWQRPSQGGLSGVGGLARFQIFPGYTWICCMRVQTESCLSGLIITLGMAWACQQKSRITCTFF